MQHTTRYQSPVGLFTLGCRDGRLTAVWWENQEYFKGVPPEESSEKDDLPIFTKTKQWFDRYFAGKKPDIAALPLAPEGGAFRREVWNILCEIPYGETTTYGAIARQIAQKMGKQRMSSQAVGGAVGHNPISVIIPCHRVVGADGNLTGYAAGLERKVALLAHEGVDMSALFMPGRKRRHA